MKMIQFYLGTKEACSTLLEVRVSEKFFFGTLDYDDANYDSSKINNLENEQMEFLKLSKEQVTVVKSTLRS
jgi:hypothetical protein